MSHPATERLHLLPAPAGLALVQDLLNTRDIGQKVPDLLATADQARGWIADLTTADGAASEWGDELTEHDLEAVRALRTEIRNLVAGEHEGCPATVVATVGLSLLPSGEVALGPNGTGTRGFASAVWGEILLAQRSDTWRRLKLCRNAVCSSAFYDRSKNNSGVWHDVKMCGNAANLRASRARRRAASPGAEPR